LQRLYDLLHVYDIGPFGDNSLFAKVLVKINKDAKAGPRHGRPGAALWPDVERVINSWRGQS
jgi:hypothetical protein